MKKATLFFILSLFLITNSFAQNVGVGTSSPETILHIAETKTATDGADGVFVNIQNTTPLGVSGSLAGIRFRMDGVGTPANSRYKGGIFFQKTGSFGIGTLHFLTNSIGSNTSVSMADARMSITSLGDVGIGTTTPNHRLHVNGGDLFLQSSAGSFRLGYDGGDQWKFSTTGGGQDLLWSTSTDGVSSAYKHYFAQNGNVGIGTGSTSPTTRLQVSTNLSEVLRLNGANPYISFYDNTDGYKGYLWYNGTDMTLGSSTAAIRFAAGGYRMSINTDGRVSIGSSNSPATGYLLSVDGKVICEEARVQISGAWPDYVFDKKYKLLSIEDVEKHIQLKGHLPNIPAAAVVEKDGLDLGDMNKRLLEKVEELTLYIIELNKENKALANRVTRLEKAND